jgi:hypothetical protein
VSLQLPPPPTTFTPPLVTPLSRQICACQWCGPAAPASRACTIVCSPACSRASLARASAAGPNAHCRRHAQEGQPRLARLFPPLAPTPCRSRALLPGSSGRTRRWRTGPTTTTGHTHAARARSRMLGSPLTAAYLYPSCRHIAVEGASSATWATKLTTTPSSAPSKATRPSSAPKSSSTRGCARPAATASFHSRTRSASAKL